MKKPLLHGVVTACFGLALTAISYAQTGTPEYDPLGEYDNLPKQIRVQVEFIDVSHEQLTELMSAPKPAANDAELRKRVGQLVKDGKATILETMLCTGKSGQRSETESIEEFIYPTEYETAELPEEIQAEDKQDSEKAEATRRESAIALTPTAFETRNIGSKLEIEPTLGSDNKIIDLRFVPEIIYHAGNKVWAEWKGKHGNVTVQMPDFYTLRINTAVTLIDGQPMLVAALSPKNQDGFPDFTRKLMIFVRADIVTVGR